VLKKHVLKIRLAHNLGGWFIRLYGIFIDIFTFNKKAYAQNKLAIKLLKNRP